MVLGAHLKALGVFELIHELPTMVPVTLIAFGLVLPAPRSPKRVKVPPVSLKILFVEELKYCPKIVPELLMPPALLEVPPKKPRSVITPLLKLKA
jgi:hypothetical protein